MLREERESVSFGDHDFCEWLCVMFVELVLIGGFLVIDSNLHYLASGHQGLEMVRTQSHKLRLIYIYKSSICTSEVE